MALSRIAGWQAGCLVLCLAPTPVLSSQRSKHDDRVARGGLEITLVLDTSNSLGDMIQNVRAVGVNLVESLDDRVLVRILVFGSKVETTQEFTADRAEIKKAILGIRASSGSSSLYNALYLGLRYASQDDQAERQPVIVAVSDGEDTSSVVTRDQVERAASSSGARFYALLLPSIRQHGGGRFLKSVAESTGGRAFQPADAGELHSAVEALALELRTLYGLNP